MSRKRDRFILAAAREIGLDVIGIDRSRRHPHLMFRRDGRIHRHAYAGTPSDWRNAKNLVSELRRRTGTCTQSKR